MLRVKELREAKGLQQKELAIDLGVSQPTISDWESGRKIPSANSTQKLADYFEVSIDYLLGRTDPIEQRAKNTLFKHMALSAKAQMAEGEKPTPGDGDGRGVNVVQVAGRDGSFYERKLSDSQREMLIQMLDNLKSVDDENV